MPGVFDGTYRRGDVATITGGAGWLVALLEVKPALAAAAAELGEIPREAAAAIAEACRLERFDLTDPLLPWHTIRLAPARLAGAIGVLAGVLAKLARDVTLLARTEVGEVSEGGAHRGGSSSMPHKHNPVAAISVLACAKRVPALVATMLQAMEQGHGRAAGAWQAEWGTLSELIDRALARLDQ